MSGHAEVVVALRKTQRLTVKDASAPRRPGAQRRECAAQLGEPDIAEGAGFGPDDRPVSREDRELIPLQHFG